MVQKLRDLRPVNVEDRRSTVGRRLERRRRGKRILDRSPQLGNGPLEVL